MSFHSLQSIIAVTQSLFFNKYLIHVILHSLSVFHIDISLSIVRRTCSLTSFLIISVYEILRAFLEYHIPKASKISFLDLKSYPRFSFCHIVPKPPLVLIRVILVFILIAIVVNRFLILYKACFACAIHIFHTFSINCDLDSILLILICTFCSRLVQNIFSTDKW